MYIYILQYQYIIIVNFYYHEKLTRPTLLLSEGISNLSMFTVSKISILNYDSNSANT